MNHNKTKCSGKQLFLDVFLNDTLSQCLIDSGATVSTISYSFCNENNWTTKIKPTSHKLIGADNIPLNVVGEIKLNLKYTCENTNNKIKFIVIRNLGSNVLLGIDFLTNHALILNAKEKELFNENISLKLTTANEIKRNITYSIKNNPTQKTIKQLQLNKQHNHNDKTFKKLKKITIKNNKSHNTITGKLNENYTHDYTKPKKNFKYKHTIINAENITLKGNTEYIMSIKTLTNKENLNIESYLEAHHEFKKKHENILIANSINYIGNKMTLKLVNLSDKTTQIKQNTPILHFTPVDKINTVNKNIHTDNNKTIAKTNNDIDWISKINIGSVTEIEKKHVLKAIKEHERAFSKGPTDLGFTNLIEHKIPTTTDKPVNRKAYRLEHSKRMALEAEIQTLLDADVIEHSTSMYNSPVLLVPKKDGSYRLVVDYRGLNSITQNETYPLPNLTDVFDSLKGNIYFSSLDLRSGYFQCGIQQCDREKTAFSTPTGKFQFKRIAQGLSGAPCTFARLMSLIMARKQMKSAWVYLDDILLMNSNFEDHLQNIKDIFKLFEQNNLKLKPEKCYLFQEEIVFLGHKLTRTGLAPNESIVDAVKNFPRPKTVKQCKSFLGLVNFYRRFIENIAKISAPLVNLTRKNQKFTWGEKEEISFQKLKSCLIKSPVLIYPDFNKDFSIYADASDYAIGAVLCQENEKGGPQAVAYMSRKLNPAECNYSTTDRELLSIVFAVKQFHPYIYGKKTKLFTDHKSLLYLQNLENPRNRSLKYIMKLQEYDLQIMHTPGKSNTCADTLSRNPLFENKSRFQNKTINFLRNLQADPKLVEKWKQQISNELKMTKANTIYEQIREIKESDNDSFYKEISKFISGTINNHKLLRQTIYKYILNNRKHYNDKHINENITDTQHLSNLKNGKEATSTELHALSAMLRVPISFQKGKNEIIILGTTETLVKTPPPRNLSIGIEQLQNNNFKIVWPIKKENQTTDNYTVNTQFEQIAHINDSNEQIPNKDEIAKLQRNDPYCKKWLKYLETNSADDIPEKHFQIHKDNIKLNDKGILLYQPRGSLRKNRVQEKERIILPEKLISLVLKLSHDNNTTAHPGKNKTWELVSYRFFRPGLNKIVTEYVKDCQICLNKNQRHKLQDVTVQPMPIADAPFQTVYADIVGPLVQTDEGNKYILVLIDSFSKYVEAWPLKNITTEDIAKTLITQFFPRYGLPNTFHTDNASNFNSELMMDVCKRLGIKKTKTTSFHAMGNGAVERANKTIIDSLKMIVSSSQRDWDYMLPFSLWAYRTTINNSIKETPSFCIMGYDPKLPLDLIHDQVVEGKYAIGITPHGYGAEIALRLKKASEWIKDVNKKAAETYTKNANKNKKDSKLKVSDLVMLFTPHVKPGHNKKLSRFFTGPFRILRQTSPVNFEIQQIGKRKKTIVHANRLKSYNPTTENYREHSWTDDFETETENDNDDKNDSNDNTIVENREINDDINPSDTDVSVINV